LLPAFLYQRGERAIPENLQGSKFSDPPVMMMMMMMIIIIIIITIIIIDVVLISPL
jgi:hypothetical protein